jgi:dTDP-4-dehydrorhamnose reductase
MKRVLILGGQGMLGQMVERVLSKSAGITIRHTRRGPKANSFRFDVEEGLDRLRSILGQYGPFDYIVNCIGVLNSLIDEKDSQSLRKAIRVNALFPHELGSLAQETGTRVIHISTDGVFGRNAGRCLEDSPSDCAEAYGKTKRLGEVIAPAVLTLRCSIIGPDPIGKKGLLEWFLGQPSGATVRGYTDHRWNGVTTRQFAGLCLQLILRNIFDEVRSEAPVHHFCPNLPVTKYELLLLFKKTFRPDITVDPATTQNMQVSRILDTRYHCLKEIFGFGRPMQDAINKLASEMRAET